MVLLCEMWVKGILRGELRGGRGEKNCVWLVKRRYASC